MEQTPGLPPRQGLYDPQNEHDACGVGLVADLGNRPSHRIVEQGLAVLRRLTHRGAAGWDPETGDGAGVLVAMPDTFFRVRLPDLPAPGRYAVAMLFGGEGAEGELEALLREEGFGPLAWRDVPVAPSALGRSARESCPRIRQLFVVRQDALADEALERRLFILRRRVEKTLGDRLYVCSFSSRSVVYKGLLLAHRLADFYADLRAPDFASALVLAHQRYSTNTFPTWSLAQPFRLLAHNGEINTLRGNLNALRAREPSLASPLLPDLPKALPLIPPGQSDSACLDNLLELLVCAGRDLPHAMLMLMPPAWGPTHRMGNDVRGFLEYESALMEPWDGPAAVVFSDGLRVGAALDRNGLRPARYARCKDGTFVLASEDGVLDLPPEAVAERGRLRPGEMLWLDLPAHRLLRDAEIKAFIARRRPYRRWIGENRVTVDGLFREPVPEPVPGDLPAQLARFGRARRDVTALLRPMAETGAEPLAAMGDDTPLAALSETPRPLADYFRQRFAQVTNPPIDPIRERTVMSLMTYMGNRANILDETAAHARLIKLTRPVLTDAELEHLGHVGADAFRPATLRLAFPRGGDGDVLAKALDALAGEATELAARGRRILILSDRGLAPDETPIPALLAVAAANRALVARGLRPETGLVVQTGEVFDSHGLALLLGYGATAVHPWLALAAVADLAARGALACPPVTATGNLIRALCSGLLKVMSKMGVSTLRSYRAGQHFEALGLGEGLVGRWLPGTVSRIGGVGLDVLADEANRRASAAAPAPERHAWAPRVVAALRQAVREGDEARYRAFARAADHPEGGPIALRQLLDFAPATPIPLDEVEGEAAILRRFVAGAMSLGSLSPEAHATIARALNAVGARSNSGEGGENPERFGTDCDSAVKQVASGRFGVTAAYLRDAKEIQIKMAQGAKPGEGGQLPGHKVDDFVARVRHAAPGLTLISPPPHHDIYSIEDLAQLIHDLRTVNPAAEVSVKLVSEAGVGAVAAGVAKAHADAILISGGDGGTGAAPLTSVRHAGLPWELGLAEAHQTLTLNRLRGRVRLQVDGGLRTGRDVLVAALLGAQTFGFGSALLVCLGCVMDRRCHCNDCPAGIATQAPACRARFAGEAEHIVRYLRFVAREVREGLAALGLRSLDEACGRADLLRPAAGLSGKAATLDLSALLRRAVPDAPEPAVPRERAGAFDREWLLPALDGPLPRALALEVRNIDRSVGAGLSGEIVARFGAAGLPEGSLTVRLRGVAGQSLGAFLAPGVLLDLEGAANDGVGKGLSGGVVVVRPAPGEGRGEDVLAGNVVGYGATSGRVHIGGRVGERFAVRNSGAILTCEGTGDHGCEYMTGGRALVLGPVGDNFAAGMTGGLAYVLDEAGDFDLRCNLAAADLENVEPGAEAAAELRALLEAHAAATGSPKARRILADLPAWLPRFVLLRPAPARHAH